MIDTRSGPKGCLALGIVLVALMSAACGSNSETTSPPTAESIPSQAPAGASPQVIATLAPSPATTVSPPPAAVTEAPAADSTKAAATVAAVPSVGAESPSQARQDLLTVTIVNFAHENLSVRTGTTVTWVNDDRASHTTTSGAQGEQTHI